MRGFNAKTKKQKIKEDEKWDIKFILNPLTEELEQIKLSDYLNSLIITSEDIINGVTVQKIKNKTYNKIDEILRDEINARNLLNETEEKLTKEEEEKRLNKFTEMMKRARDRLNELEGKQ